MHRILVLLLVAIAAGVTVLVVALPLPRPASGANAEPQAVGVSTLRTSGIDDPSSLEVVVNKLRPLTPLDYRPSDLVAVDIPHGNGGSVELRQPAADAVVAMFAAFTRDTGHTMESESAFRSFEDQQATYDSVRKSLGERAAEDSAARPGYSEHQTGLAIDIGQEDSTCDSRNCFAATAAGVWLRTHAWRYGFIIRYPAGQSAVTGYEYEPWHLRYLGVATAKAVHFHATSLETYFGLEAAPDYAN